MKFRSIVVVGLLVGSCSPPPGKLVVQPASVAVAANLGDAAPAEKGFVLQLQSDQPAQSVAWILSVSQSWLKGPSQAGGTPADVAFTIDYEALKYGPNEAKVRFESKEGAVEVPVKIDVRGCLTLAPSQAISLQGNVGEASSGPAVLTVDSPEKAGLRWTARTDDPWIRITPSEGVTPSKVTVTAELTAATDRVSGRIQIQPEFAWKSVPMVVPVGLRLLNPPAVRKQIDAKLQILKLDWDRFMSEEMDRFMQVSKSPSLDGVVAALKKMQNQVKDQVLRFQAQADDLLIFLDQNIELQEALQFNQTRAWVDEKLGHIKKVQSRLEKTIANIKDVRMGIDSQLGEWQAIGITVRKGDFLALETSGKWTLGPTAGSSDSEGLPEGQYKGSSIYPNLRHGCLLVRFGEPGKTISIPGMSVLEAKDVEGAMSGRCNDKDCTNNRGTINLRVVLIPFSE